MIGIEQKDYNKVSEEIVFEYLMNQYRKGRGKKPMWILPKEGSGDIKVGNKIIEVKGQKWINRGQPEDNFDFVGNYVTISEGEEKLLDKKSELFDVYIVYNLGKQEDEEYESARISIVKGTDLVNYKKYPRSYPTVRIKTIKETNIWKNIKPIRTKHLKWKIKDLRKKAQDKKKKDLENS